MLCCGAGLCLRNRELPAGHGTFCTLHVGLSRGEIIPRARYTAVQVAVAGREDVVRSIELLSTTAGVDNNGQVWLGGGRGKDSEMEWDWPERRKMG